MDASGAAAGGGSGECVTFPPVCGLSAAPLTAGARGDAAVCGQLVVVLLLQLLSAALLLKH